MQTILIKSIAYMHFIRLFSFYSVLFKTLRFQRNCAVRFAFFSEPFKNEEFHGVCRTGGNERKRRNEDGKADMAARMPEFKHIARDQNGKRNGKHGGRGHSGANR